MPTLKFCLMALTVLFAVNLAKADHHLPTPDFFVDTIFSKYSQTGNITFKDLEDIMVEKLLLNNEDHAHDHDHDHRRIAPRPVDLGSSHRRISRRQAPKADDFGSCYSANNLVEIFNLDNSTQLITKSDFQALSPALVLMAISSECKEVHAHAECTPSMGQRFLYGGLSIAIIWVVNFSALVFVALLNKNVLNNALRGLAVGTLLSDALLHIIPSALGLHDHSADSSHQHRDDNPDMHDELRSVIYKMCVVMGTIFGLWMIECFFSHSHCHHLEDEEGHEMTTPHSNRVHSHSHGHRHTHHEVAVGDEKMVAESVAHLSFVEYLKSVKTNGWIAYGSDCLHKIADGLVIGAAYHDSFNMGLSTALAILFHEIPHALGDYGLLISAGLTKRSILVMNILSSLLSLGAFFIIAGISLDSGAREWIYAITAGVFIYLAHTNMLNSLKPLFQSNDSTGKRNWSLIVLILALFFGGWLLMFLLAIFEEQIQFDLIKC